MIFLITKHIFISRYKRFDITTEHHDLKQANSIARQYVSMFGLSDNIALYDSSDPSMPFLEEI